MQQIVVRNELRPGLPIGTGADGIFRQAQWAARNAFRTAGAMIPVTALINGAKRNKPAGRCSRRSGERQPPGAPSCQSARA